MLAPASSSCGSGGIKLSELNWTLLHKDAQEETFALLPGTAGTGACKPVSTRGNLREFSHFKKHTKDLDGTMQILLRPKKIS